MLYHMVLVDPHLFVGSIAYVVQGPPGRKTGHSTMHERVAADMVVLTLMLLLCSPVSSLLTPWLIVNKTHNRAAAKSPRLVLENCTLVVSPLALDQYLFKATLFRVHPAGFTQQLQQLASYVSEWEVLWLEDDNSVITNAFMSSASAWHSVNMTAHPVIATALPLPDRSAIATAAVSQQLLSEYELTHAGFGAKRATALEQHRPLNPASSRDLIMLTTNITFKPAGGGDAGEKATAAPPSNALDAQLLRFLAANVGQQPPQQHTLLGIVTPPVTLDMSYSQDLVQLPPATPAGHLVFINVVMLHLSQGPKASSPDATVLLPDVWTHLLWGIQRCVERVCWCVGVLVQACVCVRC